MLAAARRDLDAPVDGDGPLAFDAHVGNFSLLNDIFSFAGLNPRVLLLVEYFERPGAAERLPRRLRGLLVALDDREFRSAIQSLPA